MSLLKLGQSQFDLTKESPNILAATRLIRPWLKSPIVQVVISFVVGYYATTKIPKIYALIIKQSRKRRSASEFPEQLAAAQDSPLLAKSQLTREPEALRLTHRELTAFDGVHDKQHIYTALNGNIYDLTSSRDAILQPGIYSLLAGCNANQVLNITCGSMGVSADDVIERWERSLNAEFNIIGYLIESDASESDDNKKDDSTVAYDSGQE